VRRILFIGVMTAASAFAQTPRTSAAAASNANVLSRLFGGDATISTLRQARKSISRSQKKTCVRQRLRCAHVRDYSAPYNSRSRGTPDPSFIAPANAVHEYQNLLGVNRRPHLVRRGSLVSRALLDADVRRNRAARVCSRSQRSVLRAALASAKRLRPTESRCAEELSGD